MENILMQFFREHFEEIDSRWKEILLENIPELTEDRLQKELTQNLFNILHQTMDSYVNEHEDLDVLADSMVQIGKPILFLLVIIDYYETSIYDILREDTTFTKDEKQQLGSLIRSYKNKVILTLTQKMEKQYDDIIRRQKLSLQELSTPIMPAFDRIIIVPLVGTIDTERAKQIMETLLDGVIKYKAEIVLIDITGVPFVNSAVTHHIVQMIRAIHIVGGLSMLVGIRPEIAQKFAELEVDLTGIITLGTLQEGVEAALEQTNRKISEVD